VNARQTAAFRPAWHHFDTSRRSIGHGYYSGLCVDIDASKSPALYTRAMSRARGFTDDELAAIANAVEAGKVKRVRSGHWPDASRPEIVPPGRRTPYMREMLARGDRQGSPP
jgi:hypothetical protein